MKRITTIVILFLLTLILPNNKIMANAEPTWSSFASPTSEWLTAVSMVSSTDGWAVGFNGTILRYDGSTWEVFTSPTTKDLYDVSMASSNAGWAVGGSGGIDESYLMLHWNGVSWSEVSLPDLGYSGNPPLLSVSALSENEVWATPRSGSGALKWDGSSWSVISIPDWGTIDGLYVSAISSDNVWFTGERSWHWDGQDWEMFDPGGPYSKMSVIPGSNGNEGWCAGYKYLFHWDGFGFDAVDGPFEAYTNSAAMVSDTDGWIVGENGIILQYTGAEAWVSFTSPVTTTLASVDMVSASDGWIVGENGTILHYGVIQSNQIYLPMLSK